MPYLLVGPRRLTEIYAQAHDLPSSNVTHASRPEHLYGRRIDDYDLVEVITHPSVPWPLRSFVLAHLDAMRLQAESPSGQ